MYIRYVLVLKITAVQSGTETLTRVSDKFTVSGGGSKMLL